MWPKWAKANDQQPSIPHAPNIIISPTLLLPIRATTILPLHQPSPFRPPSIERATSAPIFSHRKGNQSFFFFFVKGPGEIVKQIVFPGRYLRSIALTCPPPQEKRLYHRLPARRVPPPSISFVLGLKPCIVLGFEPRFHLFFICDPFVAHYSWINFINFVHPHVIILWLPTIFSPLSNPTIKLVVNIILCVGRLRFLAPFEIWRWFEENKGGSR